jgi:tetratricopeptide (TPR) repeat protein
MTTSLTTLEPSEEPFAPRIPQIVGRQKHIEAIRAAITDPTGKSHVLYFSGPGGVGKTRLLEEVEVIQKKRTGTPFRSTGVIDLYYADYHSPGGLRQAIADGLDPDNYYFRTYRVKYVMFAKMRREGVAGRELQELRREIDALFQQEYTVLAQEQRLALCFDTMELIEYESSIIQEICQIQDEDTIVKTWLLEHVSRFPNTVTLFAGRPRPKVQSDFQQAFTQAGCIFELFELGSFEKKETQAYLQIICKQRPELVEILKPEVRRRIFYLTKGRPIYLTLLIDLLIHGEALGQQFPVSAEAAQDVDEALIGQQLVEYLLKAPGWFCQMIHFLMHARKGLNADLLRYLVGDSWSEAEVQQYMTHVREFAFVKTRPGTTQLFLHDEIYDLFDRYFRGDPHYGREYEAIAHYYRQRLAAATSLSEREELMVTQLYYEFQVDARAGYYQYYARWDEDAIKSSETGFDMRLRDEALRFLDRYTLRESPFYDPRIADRVDRESIDRDSAVRWVKRYLARGEFQTARHIAEALYSSERRTFKWDIVDAVLYKAGLLTAWGEAMLYLGLPEAISKLEEAVKLVEAKHGWDEDQSWWRARILGRAYNNIGYLYRTRGSSGSALEYYRQALPYFAEADIPDERADTLNNLAFMLALSGRINTAQRNIDQALKIRQQIGRRYPIALSHNTRGLIYTLQDHPLWGSRECQEALRICEELQQIRGIGLACNGLGLALRKRGDQWKLDAYSQKEAEEYFQRSVEYLQRAIRIFSDQVEEPFRLWEAYNELGSLYCDWGWLTRHLEDSAQSALWQYERSIGYQREALEVAKKHKLQFQIVDSYDDLAQVYSDRSFLLISMHRLEEAQESRVSAKEYINQVLELIPENFRMEPGAGFSAAPGAGEAYWLPLGKVHLWQGIWAFRDLEANQIPTSQRPDVLMQATQQLIRAVAIFRHYWPESFALNHTLGYFSRFLQNAGVSADWAHEQIGNFSHEYQINLDILDETIIDILGP